jgi:three-Cys-motif partner protein
MRDSNDYAKDKLRILNGYISRFIVAMREKPMRALYYIDLEAGPGKNRFKSNGDIMNGSPLIALNARFPFTHYRFVEQKKELVEALKTRVAASDRHDRVRVLEGDCNVMVDFIVREIQTLDNQFIAGKQKSLNLAFLDPEGLELEWQTVEKLGKIERIDLIINFSTSGFTRNANQMLEKDKADKLDRFFGTPDWRGVYQPVSKKDNTHVRREMLDFYKTRLATLGYKIHPEEKVFRSSKNMQIYTLMFASKHPLGNKFWSGAIKEVSQPPLF